MYDVSWQWCMLWLLYLYCILHNLSTLPWVLMLVNIAGEHCCVLAVSHHISTKHPSLYNVTRVRVRFGFIVIICFDSCNTLILIEIRITLKNYILQKQDIFELYYFDRFRIVSSYILLDTYNVLIIMYVSFN